MNGMYEMDRKIKYDGFWTADLKFIHDYNTEFKNLTTFTRPKSKYGPKLIDTIRNKDNNNG